MIIFIKISWYYLLGFTPKNIYSLFWEFMQLFLLRKDWWLYYCGTYYTGDITQMIVHRWYGIDDDMA